MIRELARVVPAPPGKPVREEAAAGQERARHLALRPGTWDRQQAAAMRAGFDAAAGGWEASRGGYRRPVLADALARGGPFRPGLAVEVASGTGLLTPLIAEVFGVRVGHAQHRLVDILRRAGTGRHATPCA